MVVNVCIIGCGPVTTKDGETKTIISEPIGTNDNQTKSGVIDLFINSIENGEKPEISVEEGLAALEIISACFESSATGKKVYV